MRTKEKSYPLWRTSELSLYKNTGI